MLEVDCQEVQICFWNPGVRKGGSMRATMERMGNSLIPKAFEGRVETCCL